MTLGTYLSVTLYDKSEALSARASAAVKQSICSSLFRHARERTGCLQSAPGLTALAAADRPAAPCTTLEHIVLNDAASANALQNLCLIAKSIVEKDHPQCHTGWTKSIDERPA